MNGEIDKQKYTTYIILIYDAIPVYTHWPWHFIQYRGGGVIKKII